MNAGDEMVRGLGVVLDLHQYVTFGSCSAPDCDWKPEPWDEEDATTPYPDQHRDHVASILAAHVLGLVAAGKAEAWDEAAQAVAWVLTNGPTETAAEYLLAHNPYRADGLAGEAS